MIRNHFKYLKTVLMITAILLLSACNGEKIDSDLIDSITGKVSVDRITIDQEDFEMIEGESTILTATVLPAEATDKTVSWNSSKEDVVMISNTGKVMAIAPGKSIITAKAGSKTDFITITVIANAVRVTGISLDKATLELKVGDSETLTATVTPDNATNKNVSWTSSDATVATVENGRVTGAKPGSVTITAKTEDGDKTAECAVTIKTNLAPSVTVGSENVSAVSVVLKGEANLDAQMSSDMTMGIMWSENSGVLPSNSTKIEAKNIEAKEGSTTSYCYSVNLTSLDPEKTYYFRSYVTQNSQDTYGETMSFTTKSLSSMIHTEDASNVSAVSVVMNATYDLTDVQYTSKTIGLYYGTSAESLSNTYIAEISAATGIISKNWPVLKPATEYFYQAYVILDDKLYVEDIKPFTTKELSSMLETKDAYDIASTSAKVNAKLDMTDVQYTTMDYGFYYGDEYQNTYAILCGEIVENAYSALLSFLSPTSQYWYKSYLKIDGQTFYGEIKTFTTDNIDVQIYPTELSLYYCQEAKLVANISSEQCIWVACGTGDEGAPVQIISHGAEGDNATFAIVKAISQNGSGSVKLLYLKNYSTLASCTVTVNTIQITDVELEKNSVSLVLQPKVGESKTYQIQATVKPDNATFRELSYESEDPAIASVDDSGLITAVSQGETKVFVRTQDGSDISKEIIVRVVPAVEKPIAIAFETPNDDFYLPDMQVGAKQTVNLLWHPLNATEKSYTLTFEPEGYVRVVEQTEDYFVIKALRSGNVKIGLVSPYFTIKDNFRYNLAIQAGSPYLEWDWTGMEQYINDYSTPGVDYLMLSYNETPKVKLNATAYNISNPSYVWETSATKLACDPNGYYWVSQDVTSIPSYYNVYVQLNGNPESKIQYAVRYYKEPKLIYADRLSDNQPITSIQLSESKRQEDVVFYVRTKPGDNRSCLRQVMCYTLSNSLTDYVRLEKMAKYDDENLFRDQYIIVRKKAPASKRTGTLTVWPLGYPRLTKTIDITVE